MWEQPTPERWENYGDGKNANMELKVGLKQPKQRSRGDLFQLIFKRSNTHSIRSKRSDRRFVSGDDLKLAQRENLPHLVGGGVWQYSYVQLRYNTASKHHLCPFAARYVMVLPAIDT